MESLSRKGTIDKMSNVRCNHSPAIACLDKDEKSLAREYEAYEGGRGPEWSILNEFIREKVAGWLN